MAKKQESNNPAYLDKILLTSRKSDTSEDSISTLGDLTSKVTLTVKKN